LDVNNVLLAIDQDKKIHALHSFEVSGGTLLCPNTKLMLLLGLGSSATAFLVDKQSLLNPCNLITPTIDNLQVCSDKDEVNSINALPNNGAVTYQGSASFFAAPWLIKTIMDTGTASDYSKLIPAVNTVAIKFNAKHKNDTEYTTSASNHAGNFILWAWGAGTGQVSATRMTFDPNDDDLGHFKN
jgi:hypothetical protein